MFCHDETGILGSNITQYVNMVRLSVCSFSSTNIHPSNLNTLIFSSKSHFSFNCEGWDYTLDESTNITHKWKWQIGCVTIVCMTCLFVCLHVLSRFVAMGSSRFILWGQNEPWELNDSQWLKACHLPVGVVVCFSSTWMAVFMREPTCCTR